MCSRSDRSAAVSARTWKRPARGGGEDMDRSFERRWQARQGKRWPMPQHALPESVLPVQSILPALAYVFQLRAQADEQRHKARVEVDRKSTRLNSSHSQISYAVFCLKKKKKQRVLAFSRSHN